MRIDSHLTPEIVQAKIETLLELSAAKIHALETAWSPEQGAPVFTVQGHYMARGWTDWTLGFMFGSALLQYDATGDPWFLEYGRRGTRERMANYVTHTGVHDHGFNIVSTYGNLLRLLEDTIFRYPLPMTSRQPLRNPVWNQFKSALVQE